MTRHIIECDKRGYPARTRQNVCSSDLTIAIANDFTTAGEKLTASLCDKYKKPIIRIYMRDVKPTHEQAIKIHHWCVHNSISINTVNIAGNGIYSLPYTQNKCNNFVLEVLLVFTYFIPIKHIVCGGQTGIDEAGIHSAEALKIPWTVLAPKGWLFRGKDGKDISDEKLFKARFPYPLNQ